MRLLNAVHYYSMEIPVTGVVKYLAVDASGKLLAFTEEPRHTEDTWVGEGRTELYKVDLEYVDWKNSASKVVLFKDNMFGVHLNAKYIVVDIDGDVFTTSSEPIDSSTIGDDIEYLDIYFQMGKLMKPFNITKELSV